MDDNQPKEYYQLYLQRAGEDEISAQRLYEAGEPYSPVCFHSQQMAEKLLKALLVFHKMEFAKSHDLILLANKLEVKVPDILKIKDDLEYLNHLDTEARYIEDFHIFEKQEAAEALSRAAAVKNFVMPKVKAD